MVVGITNLGDIRNVGSIGGRTVSVLHGNDCYLRYHWDDSR